MRVSSRDPSHVPVPSRPRSHHGCVYAEHDENDGSGASGWIAKTGCAKAGEDGKLGRGAVAGCGGRGRPVAGPADMMVDMAGVDSVFAVAVEIAVVRRRFGVGAAGRRRPSLRCKTSSCVLSCVVAYMMWTRSFEVSQFRFGISQDGIK